MEDRQNNYIKPKQMSYKYWLVGMISQGMADGDYEPEEFADIVVDRVEAVLERLREDKRRQRNSEEY
jgi:hypothetical protein